MSNIFVDKKLQFNNYNYSLSLVHISAMRLHFIGLWTARTCSGKGSLQLENSLNVGFSITKTEIAKFYFALVRQTDCPAANQCCCFVKISLKMKFLQHVCLVQLWIAKFELSLHALARAVPCVGLNSKFYPCHSG